LASIQGNREGTVARPLKIGLHLPEVERVAPWREIATMARLAEEVGFDSIWMPDHLLFRKEGEATKGPWECWSMLAAVAGVTTRVEIGPLVLCTNFREPGLIAKMASTVDEISGGRLILGLGAGWHQPEYDAFGFDYAHRVGRFKEAFTIIHALLRDGAIDFEGTYYTLRECEIRPRGPRPGSIPLMIGSKGDLMLRATVAQVEYWNGWHIWNQNRPEGLAPLTAQVDRACAAVGRDPATLARTTAVYVRFPDATEPPIPRHCPIMGTPEEIAEQLRAFARAGMSHLQIVLDPNTLGGIEQFAPVLELLDR
jgi:alkanesulfonate monooxygenase SsuD/methylene tetrahydromethanopterin reductase-like flavin-dependent oxidoreductase (luciferase family)